VPFVAIATAALAALATTHLAKAKPDQVPVNHTLPGDGVGGMSGNESPFDPTRPFQILDGDVLRRRSIEVFPTAYATILSIVQGIALGTLAVRAALLIHDPRGTDLTVVIFEAVATIAVIAVVYYNYMWFLLLFRWAPRIWDTLIPLALGIASIGVASTVGLDGAWLLFLAAIQAVAIPSFWHTIRRSNSRMFSDPRDHSSTIHLLRGLIITMLLGAVVAVLAAWLFFLGRDVIVPESIVIVVVGTGMVIASERTLKRVFRRNGLTS
jgi:hypothetical protein